ncbi:dihydroorotase [Propionibacteriaceae bacterium ES.041]|nr:dihydroorotase [Propionibacteriaceae bacterium ES.041]
MSGLLLRGGRVLAPASGLDERADVLIRDGLIAAIGADLDAGDAEVRDVSGELVLPGLVDMHSHLFSDFSLLGAPVDEAHLHRGVVAAADAGTAGAATFAAFERYIARPARTRTLAFLNVSTLGVQDIKVGECHNPAALDLPAALKAATDYPDLVRGFKLRASEEVVDGSAHDTLVKSREIAGRAGLPLMVHIGDTVESLSELLPLLTTGDIVTHCYTGKSNGTLVDGRVLDAVLEARERGVLFDSAHGASNFSFAVAKEAVGQGFLPDVVSSDTSARNWRGPVYDLVTTMSKLRAVGMALPDIVDAVTARPAQVLHLDAEGFGTLRVGGPANVTVLTEAGPTPLRDSAKNSEEWMVDRLEPVLTVRAGDLVEPTAWRGLTSTDDKQPAHAGS